MCYNWQNKLDNFFVFYNLLSEQKINREAVAWWIAVIQNILEKSIEIKASLSKK